MAVRREEERTTVDRYPGRVRVNHWITAISLILLALSGAALFHPALFFLSGLFGGGANTRAIHPWIGVVLLASFAILFVQMVRYNFWAKVDTVWMRHIGDVMSGHEENLPEIGKYNGAQKIVFWLMTLLILVLFATGIMIWYEYFGASFTIEQQRFAHIIHALAAVAMLLVVIVHIYAGFYVRGTISAMTEGKVTGGWAFRHHRLWLRHEAREGVIDDRQTPPRRVHPGPAE
ncbi:MULTISPECIES: formate dehydrogenase subunit gamma [unclassified Bosea (in: a-proteobacteria)]|uniref:formate dehydrogenase subunit gamma n=1 Tax=unclassified Bosea (in: a-proteobacteria) TaxID=2653178 RepID=UPI000B262A46|nr:MULTISPECIES: formate dehydrogenase subunit gamma [unclassified Bosea (in: a-proteobacteria)]